MLRAGIAKGAISIMISAALLGTVKAATINVTTTADEFGTNAADCALREAVQAANTNAAFGGCNAGSVGHDRIRLRAGLYILTLGTAGENNNAEGDLDITEALTIEGPRLETSNERGYSAEAKRVRPKAIIENGIGLGNVIGDGDRVLHVDPDGLIGDVDLRLFRVTIAEGDVSCDGVDCDAGGAGIDQEGNGDVVLDRAVVARNTVSCTGQDCGGFVPFPITIAAAGAIRSIGGGTLKLDRANIIDNRATCSEVGCTSGHGGIFWGQDSSFDNNAPLVRIEESIIESNVSVCHSNQCFSNEIVSARADTIRIEDTLFTYNRAECTSDGDPLSLPVNEDDRCDSEEIIATQADNGDTWRWVDFIANTLSCEGNDCDTDEVHDAGTGGNSVMNHMAFVGNTLKCRGTDCDTDEVMDSFIASGTLTFSNITFLDNLQSCTGFNCDTDEVIDGSTGGNQGTTWTKILVQGNRQICFGESCDTDEVVDSNIGGSGPNRVIRELVVTENKQFCYGVECDTDEVLDSASGENYTFIDVEVSKNQAFCKGTNCFIDAVIDQIEASVSLTINGFVVTDNTRRCEGDGCQFFGVFEDISSPNANIRHLEIARNRVSCIGNDCAVLLDESQDPNLIEFDNLTGEVRELWVEDNIIECIGNDDCSDQMISGIRIDNSNVTIRQAWVENNRVPGDGAGFVNGGSQGPGILELRNSSIVGNRAGGNGGGLFNPAGAVATLRRVEIIENRANNGGGIFNEGTLNLINSPVADNVPNDCVNSGGGTGC